MSQVCLEKNLVYHEKDEHSSKAPITELEYKGWNLHGSVDFPKCVAGNARGSPRRGIGTIRDGSAR